MQTLIFAQSQSLKAHKNQVKVTIFAAKSALVMRIPDYLKVFYKNLNVFSNCTRCLAKLTSLQSSPRLEILQKRLFPFRGGSLII